MAKIDKMKAQDDADPGQQEREHDQQSSKGLSASVSPEREQENFDEEFLDPPMSSRFSLEIRLGLGILGVLVFVLAALIAYRLMTARSDETAQSKPPEAQATSEGPESVAPAAAPSENRGGESEDQSTTLPLPNPPVAKTPQVTMQVSQSAGDVQTLSPPPAMNLPASQGAVAATESLANASAWWNPPFPDQTPTPDAYRGGSGSESANPQDLAHAFSSIEPAGLVAQNQGGSPPSPPFANANAQIQGQAANLDTAGWNAGVSNTDGLNLYGTAEQGSLGSQPGITGSISGSQPATIGQAFVPTDASAGNLRVSDPNTGSSAAFPGDFFAGAAPLSQQPPGTMTGASSAGQDSYQSGWPNQATNTPSQSRLTAQDGLGTLQQGQIYNDPFAARSLGGSESRPATEQFARPYAPPLAAGSGTPQSPAAFLQPGPNQRIYTVQEGETLFDIARQQLGKASRWVEIYQLNRDRLGERLEHYRPGLTLLLPADSTTSPGNRVPKQ